MSTWGREQPLLSTVAATPVPGQRSQALPTPSASASTCVLLAVLGQLSVPVHQLLLGAPGEHTPSWSGSTCACEQPLGSVAAPDGVPGQASQASPTPSLSLSTCEGLETVGQLSLLTQPDGPADGAPGLQTPSPSESTCAFAQPLASTAAPRAVPGQRSRESITPSASLSLQFPLPTTMVALSIWSTGMVSLAMSIGPTPVSVRTAIPLPTAVRVMRLKTPGPASALSGSGPRSKVASLNVPSVSGKPSVSSPKALTLLPGAAARRKLWFSLLTWTIAGL